MLKLRSQSGGTCDRGKCAKEFAETYDHGHVESAQGIKGNETLWVVGHHKHLRRSADWFNHRVPGAHSLQQYASIRGRWNGPLNMLPFARCETEPSRWR